MNWLIYLPLPFLIVSLVGCQEQRAMRRQGHSALRQLSRDDRRKVAWALRRGQAVEEQRLVGPTLAWTRSTADRCRWDDLFLGLWLAIFPLDAGLAMRAGDWKRAAVILLGFDFFALTAAVGEQFRRRARETEVATLSRYQQEMTEGPAAASAGRAR